MTKEQIQDLRMTDYFGRDVGAKMLDVSGDHALFSLDVEQRHSNPSGTIHGGVLFTMCDITAGSAAHSFGNYTTTTDANIHYLRAVIGLETIYCEATLLKRGRSLIVYDVKIKDADGKVYTSGTFSYFDLGIPIGEKVEDHE